MNKSNAWRRILVFSVVFSLMAVIPQGSLAQTKKGIELYSSGEYREADKILQAALNTDASDVLANYYLGLSALAQENFRDALDIFLKVKKSQDRADQWTRPPVPNEYQTQMGLARSRIGLQQYAEAWKNLELARIENGSSSEVYTFRGLYYLQQEKHPEAIRELERAISLDGKNAYAYYYVGLAYYRSGDPQKAVDALKIFLNLAPYAPEAVKAKELVDKLC